MAEIKFANNVDAGGYEIRNRKVEIVSDLPSPKSTDEGREVYNSSDKRYYVCTGSAYKLVATDSDKLNAKAASFYLDRTNHTGNISSSVVSDFDVQVQSNRLDQLASPNKNIDLNGHKINGLDGGIDPNDAVNRSQLDELSQRVDAGAAGVSIKRAVRAVSNSDITLSGTQTVDNVAVVEGDRVLVAGQSDAKKNGIYIVKSGSWVRSIDADTDGQLASGTLVAVQEGDSEGDSLWGLTTDVDIVVGDTEQEWARVIAGSTGGFTSAGNGLKDGGGGRIDVQAGQGIVADGSSTRIDTSVVARKYVGDVPGGNKSATINHSLDTKDVMVTVKDANNNDIVLCGVNVTASNSITLDFGDAPSSGQYRVIVIG